jgi:hypothetical protein
MIITNSVIKKHDKGFGRRIRVDQDGESND